MPIRVSLSSSSLSEYVLSRFDWLIYENLAVLIASYFVVGLKVMFWGIIFPPSDFWHYPKLGVLVFVVQYISLSDFWHYLKFGVIDFEVEYTSLSDFWHYPMSQPGRRSQLIISPTEPAAPLHTGQQLYRYSKFISVFNIVTSDYELPNNHVVQLQVCRWPS